MAQPTWRKQVKRLHNRLERHSRKLVKAERKGLKKAGGWLQAESQQIVPVWTGNLRGSAFTRSLGTLFKPVVEVGYEAAYAIYVHENPNAAHGAEFNTKHATKIAANPGHKYYFNRGANQQYKFLERPFREGQATIQRIIRMEIEKVRFKK